MQAFPGLPVDQAPLTAAGDSVVPSPMEIHPPRAPVLEIAGPAGGVLEQPTRRTVNMLLSFESSKLDLVKVKHLKSIFQKRTGMVPLSVVWRNRDLTDDSASMKDIGVTGEADFTFVVDKAEGKLGKHAGGMLPCAHAFPG